MSQHDVEEQQRANFGGVVSDEDRASAGVAGSAAAQDAGASADIAPEESTAPSDPGNGATGLAGDAPAGREPDPADDANPY